MREACRAAGGEGEDEGCKGWMERNGEAVTETTVTASVFMENVRC